MSLELVKVSERQLLEKIRLKDLDGADDLLELFCSEISSNVCNTEAVVIRTVELIMGLSSEIKDILPYCGDVIREDFRFLRKFHEFNNKIEFCSWIRSDIFKNYIKLIEPICKHSKIVNFITNYIEKNYSKEISLEEISNEVNFNMYYLSKVFKKSTGKSIKQYLIDFRLEKAKILLASNITIPVKQVAWEVGYPDEKYFGRIFKNKIGMPPAEYRNLKSRVTRCEYPLV